MQRLRPAAEMPVPGAPVPGQQIQEILFFAALAREQEGLSPAEPVEILLEQVQPFSRWAVSGTGVKGEYEVPNLQSVVQ